MDTPYFAILLAVLELTFYYLSLDLAIICVISLCLTFSVIFKKNLNVLLIIFFFMSSMISFNHSPGNIFFPDDPLVDRYYYYQPEVFIPCIVAAAIPVISIIVRCIANFAKRRIKFTATNIVVITFGFLLLLNGLLIDKFNPFNLLFAVFILFFYVILFFGILPDVSIDKKSILNISRSVAIYSLVLVVETAVLFITNYINGIDFEYIQTFYGWGNENTCGMLLVICFCFLIYLFRFESSRIVKGLTHLLALFVVASVIMIASRQAYLFLAAVGFGYPFILIFRSEGKTKVKSIVFTSVGAILACGALVVMLTTDLFDKAVADNGRFDLWTKALDSFVNHPVFGGGFYFLGDDEVIRMNGVMPLCCHNTILEMMGAGGLLALLGYLTYRTFTYITICKNMSKEKVTVVIAVTVMILMSLIDIHILDLLGSALYVALLAMAMSKKPESEQIPQE